MSSTRVTLCVPVTTRVVVQSTLGEHKKVTDQPITINRGWTRSHLGGKGEDKVLCPFLEY